MGMFNSIVADLTCPSTGEESKRVEIQIKWQSPGARELVVYRLGDRLEQLGLSYDNTWVKTDYICNVCSPKIVGYDGVEFIRSMDQTRHPVFVRIEQAKICEIISEAEFQSFGDIEYVVDW